MSTEPESTGNAAGVSDYWLARRDQLFLASVISLIVTAMSFAIRGGLIGNLEKQFNLSPVEIGIITGTAFWGFALATLIGGPLCDVVGMGRLLALAFITHVAGILTIIFANGFWTLFIGTLFFGIANGCVEAACNPLIATLYPDQKIKRLSLFHVWFPGGIVIGGLVSFAISSSGIGGKDHGWQIQMASMFVPLAIYGFMFLGKKFPQTERAASGISMGTMFKEATNPLFVVFVICMIMTAATELVTTQWLTNIVSVTIPVMATYAILLLVWINGLMALGRNFAGEIVHRISPVQLLIGSSVFSAIGIFTLAHAHDALTAGVSATLFAVGVCFFWPTMLGVVSERFPKTGALGLSVMGAAGMLSTAVFLPIVGQRFSDGITAALPAGADQKLYENAAAGTAEATKWAEAQAVGGAAGLNTMVILPVILTVAFVALYLYDQSRGGYKKETLTQDQLSPTELGEA